MHFKYLLLIILLMLTGCSYNNRLSAIKSDYGSNLNKPYTLMIDATNLYRASVTANPGLVHLTVDYGDALIESIKRNSTKHFKQVIITKNTGKPTKEPYDFILSVNTNIASVCGATSCYINNNVTVDIKKNITDKKSLLAENFSDQYTWQQPGSAVFLGIISGVTLCALCPITIPAAVNIEGDEFSNQVSISNNRISTRISDILSASDLFK